MRHEDLTRQIIGAGMSVHNELGRGFREIVYQRALAIELEDLNLPFEREIIMPIYYKGCQVGNPRADFLVDKMILIEVKAIVQLDDSCLAQSLNYLEAFNLEIGLLINFGGPRLEFKRLINKNWLPPGLPG